MGLGPLFYIFFGVEVEVNTSIGKIVAIIVASWSPRRMMRKYQGIAKVCIKVFQASGHSYAKPSERQHLKP